MKIELSKKKIIAGGIFLVLFIISIIFMIIFSFSYVEWNQYALKQNTANNKVDYNHVYENGRYFWGLARRPITFINTAITVEFTGKNSLIIFTDGGLEMNISCSFQYIIIKDELPILFRNYGTTYPQQIKSISLSILKNLAPNFTMEEYYQKRYEIRNHMFDNLKKILRRDLNVDVIYFQLDYIELPEILITKLLSIAVQNQTNIKEQYIQQASVIRQQTISMAQSIIANATVINQTAISEANFIVEKAKSEAFKIIQNAKKNGLANIYTELGLNTTDLQLSYLYTTQLAQSKYDFNLLVDVNSIIIPTY